MNNFSYHIKLHSLWFLAYFVILCAYYFLPINFVYPCAGVPPSGYELSIDNEDALIIWDGHTQKFIRRGDFKSSAPNFGFIVPTPTPPHLSEVDEVILTRLSNKTQAETIYKSRWIFTPIIVSMMTFIAGSSDLQGAMKGIKVLDYRYVAGMDAVILHADNTTALERWLLKNQYPFSPALREWSQHYIDKKWYFTAFKISKNNQESDTVQSPLVQLEFQTDHPFFPYREPKIKNKIRPFKRQLRIFMISPQPPAPYIGNKQSTTNTQWTQKVVYANRGDHRLLFKGTQLENSIPIDSWLSEIIDPSSIRSGHDELCLSATIDPKEIRRRPKIRVEVKKIPLPIDILGLIGVYLLWSRHKRKNKRKE
jgi:hypothetical protein